MGQLRTALHAYAVEGHSPSQTLQLVDRFMRTLPEPAMATAAYAVLDEDTGALCLSSAGHLPPLMIGGKQPRVLETPPAPPLGAFPYASWPEQETTMEGGETLLFYTDGLVERPGTPIDESIAGLLTLTAAATSPEEACRLAVEQLIPFGRLRDDVAMVALHYGPVPEELLLRLPAEPSVLAEMRRILRRWLTNHEVPEQDSREIVLAVNEVCANAIEHAYSPQAAEFELRATRDDGELAFVVTDTGHWRPPRGEHRGRGLMLVKATMDEVKIDSSDVGTEVSMRRRVPR